ncbi:MAG TPA: hypothetical protein VF796_22920, partial [Humisphaera sp.]
PREARQLDALAAKHRDAVFVTLLTDVRPKTPELAAFVRTLDLPPARRLAVAAPGADRDWAAFNEGGVRLDTFIVGKDGRVAWVGWTEQLEWPLAQVLAGTYTPAAEAAFRKAQEAERRLAERLVEERVRSRLPDDPAAAALAALDEVLAAHPLVRQQHVQLRVGLLARTGQIDQAYAALDAMVADADVADLIVFARAVATGKNFAAKRDLARALRYAKAAVGDGSVPAAWEVLATVHEARGEAADAARARAKAAEAARQSALQQQMMDGARFDGVDAVPSGSPPPPPR